MNRFSKLCALCAVLLMSVTVLANDFPDYVYPDWNEYELDFINNDGQWWVDHSNIRLSKLDGGATSSFSVNVTITEDATLRFHLNTYYYYFYENYGGRNVEISVAVDGETKESFNSYNFKQYTGNKYVFVELTPGNHTITWSTKNNNSTTYTDGFYIEGIGIRNTPTVSVNLLESGSLGTEILYFVDRLQNVRKLKVKGEMNSADWNTINMIRENLYSLDLSEAVTSNVPNEMFSGQEFLHTVSLPNGIKSIGTKAFYSVPLRYINFPSTLESIGQSAFYNTNIKEALLANTNVVLNSSAFSNCTCLERTSLPAFTTQIPSWAYGYCQSLQNFEIPDGVTSIGESAFNGCYFFNADLPSNLQILGRESFYGTNSQGTIKEELIIPESIGDMGYRSFCETHYSKVTLPVTFNYVYDSFLEGYYIKTLCLKSPTLVKHGSSPMLNDQYRAGITVQVPDFLVNTYKLNSYWYNFGNIEGFSTEDVDKWVIRDDLSLGARQRMLGTPSIEIWIGYGSLKISGTDPMPLNNLMVQSDPDNKSYGRIYCDAEGVTVAGNLDIHLRTGSKNRWYYACLPFNARVSDIAPATEGRKSAIRYYDGASRAENGTGGNWKNFTDDDIIPAGTGFIFQTSEPDWWYFPSQNDASKQYMTSTRMFVKQLEANTSAVASNHGWNLVGNPYQCWYNIHKINFTAPITVRNDRYNGYEAYSIIDDDYALAPNQAFFVQCPTGTTEISFPLEGRQMTNVIESQNGAPARNPQASSRQLIDVVLSNGIDSDRTRVVMNPEASMDYELTCDAGKFMSEAAIPQLYTLDENGEEYAINERPLADGKVQMGIVIPADGKYTISITRNGARKVMLQDNETGDTVDITATGYEFRAEAGTSDSRFTLIVEGNDATGIAAAAGMQSVGVYTVSGIKVPDARNLPSGTYIVKSAQGKVSKINVK